MMTLEQKKAGVEALNDLSALTVCEWDIDGDEMNAFRVIHNIMKAAVEDHIDSSDVNFDVIAMLEATPMGQAKKLAREQALEIETLKRNMQGYAAKTNSLQSRVDKANRILKRGGVDKV